MNNKYNYAVFVFSSQWHANGFRKYLRDHGVWLSPVVVRGYMSPEEVDQLVYLHDKFEYVHLPEEFRVIRAQNDCDQAEYMHILLACRFNCAIQRLPGALKVARELAPHTNFEIEISGGHVSYLYRYKTNWDVPGDNVFSDMNKAPRFFSYDPINDVRRIRMYHTNVREFELNNTLRAYYANIYVSVSGDRATVWTRVDGKDGTGMGTIDLNDNSFDEKLAHLTGQAGLANRKGFFWCSMCDTVKPTSEYRTCYFAARYCKECMEENPDVLQRALSENYN